MNEYKLSLIVTVIWPEPEFCVNMQVFHITESVQAYDEIH